MQRRGFLKLLGSAALAVTLAQKLPGIGGAPVQLPSRPEPVVNSTIFHAGDVFTIQGQYAVNPATGRSTSHLQQFFITAAVSSDDEIAPIWPRYKGRSRVPVAAVQPLGSWS